MKLSVVNNGYVAEKICKKKLQGPPYTHTNMQSFKEACGSLFLLVHHSTGPTKATDFPLLNFWVLVLITDLEIFRPEMGILEVGTLLQGWIYRKESQMTISTWPFQMTTSSMTCPLWSITFSEGQEIFAFVSGNCLKTDISLFLERILQLQAWH